MKSKEKLMVGTFFRPSDRKSLCDIVGFIGIRLMVIVDFGTQVLRNSGLCVLPSPDFRGHVFCTVSRFASQMFLKISI